MSIVINVLACNSVYGAVDMHASVLVKEPILSELHQEIVFRSAANSLCQLRPCNSSSFVKDVLCNVLVELLSGL